MARNTLRALGLGILLGLFALVSLFLATGASAAEVHGQVVVVFDGATSVKSFTLPTLNVSTAGFQVWATGSVNATVTGYTRNRQNSPPVQLFQYVLTDTTPKTFFGPVLGQVDVIIGPYTSGTINADVCLK